MSMGLPFRDRQLLASDEMEALKKKYEERFHEECFPFDRRYFFGDEKRGPAQFYKEAIEAALRDNKPLRPVKMVEHAYFDMFSDLPEGYDLAQIPKKPLPENVAEAFRKWRESQKNTEIPTKIQEPDS